MKRKKRLDMYDETYLRLIAIDRYNHNLSISAIARKWGVANGTITARLELARQLGIVSIQVYPEERPKGLPHLARRLKRKYRLEHVDLVPTYLDAEGKPLATVIPEIAQKAAQYLDEELTNESTLAVSGGRLFNRQVVSYLQPRELEGLMVLPLSGFIRSLANVGDASLIAYDLATKYGAKYAWLPIPAYVESKSAQQVAREMPIIRTVLKQVDEDADIFLIQFFAPYSSDLLAKHIFDERQIAAIDAQRPVCNVEMWFYNAQGACVNAKLPFYLTGYDINNLAKKIDDGAQVIVVGGAHPMHTQAIHVLLKAGLANVVITDHLTALNLLAD